ncbi:hypothetical protein Tco_0882934 [Tanacetum coccineum]
MSTPTQWERMSKPTQCDTLCDTFVVSIMRKVKLGRLAKDEEENEEAEEEDEEQEKEESEKKRSKEASEMGSNSKPLGYAAIDNEVDSNLKSTARSKPKCKEMEDTCLSRHSTQTKPIFSYSVNMFTRLIHPLYFIMF